MNLSLLKEKVKQAQLDNWLQDSISVQLLNMFSDYSPNVCEKCTKGCPIAATSMCHTGCTLFAAIG